MKTPEEWAEQINVFATSAKLYEDLKPGIADIVRQIQAESNEMIGKAWTAGIMFAIQKAREAVPKDWGWVLTKAVQEAARKQVEGLTTEKEWVEWRCCCASNNRDER